MALPEGLPQRVHTVDAVIAESGSLSAAVEVAGHQIVGLVMPAGWDAAAITLQGSADGSTFGNVYDKGGTEVSLTVAASRYVSLAGAEYAGLRSIKVRSGTAVTPVAQTAARTIKVILRAG